MSAVLFLGLGMTSLACCQQKNEFVIEGRLPHAFTGYVYLNYVDATKGLTSVDSIALDSADRFTFKGTLSHADNYHIATSPRKYFAGVMLEPHSHYRIDLADRGDGNVEVLSGGSEQKLWQEQIQGMASYEKQSEELNEAISHAYEEKNDILIDSLSTLSSRLFQERESATIAFIKQHPHTFTACYLAGELLIYTFPDLQAVRSQLDSVSYSGTYSYRRFMDKYNEAESHWMQGKPAPNFVTHNLEGKEVKLSDFAGHYVLLDFWASWCRPCRKRAAELKAIYSQLQARGISICGISMDDKKAQWEAATREDGIVWTNTGELKPFKESTIASDYKVTQLPTLFLVGPDGIIVSQNPTTEELLKLPLTDR